MKVSDILTFIMKIMGFRSEIYVYKRALKVKISNKVALRQVLRKQLGFQNRKNKNTPNFRGIEI